MKYLHSIKIKDKKYLYYNEKQDLVEVNDKLEKIIIDLVENNEEKKNLITKYSLTEKEYHKLSHYFFKPLQRASKKKYIDIKVNLTHDCNLACIYCYANSYKSKKYMTKEVAFDIINFLVNHFEKYNIHITFFGGEPLLNGEILTYFCETVVQLSKFDSQFTFGAVTNGTIMNKRLLETIKKFRIGLTISIDGSRDIHNQLRPYSNNLNSYEDIIGNIKEVLDQASIPIFFEATYTNLHQQKGITRLELKKTMLDMGFIDGYVVDVENCDNLLPKKEMVQTQENNLHLSSIQKQFLRKKKYRTICSIGSYHLDITPIGDIYPCQFFIGNEAYLMGNVKSTSNKFNIVKNKLKILEHDTNSICKECWARYLCKDCPGVIFRKREQLMPNEKECEMIRNKVEKQLIKLCLLRSDEKKYAEQVRKASNQLQKLTCLN